MLKHPYLFLANETVKNSHPISFYALYTDVKMII